MAITINGNGTITGVSAGGLPDGCVDNDTIATGISSSKLTGALPALDGSALTGVGGGITRAEQWRLTTNKTSAGDITGNLALQTNNGTGNINAGMTQSSGIFTFPETGIWHITFKAIIEEGAQSSNDGIIRPLIYTTTDNSTYNLVGWGQEGVAGSLAAEFTGSATATILFDVTNTTTHKVKFNIASLTTNDRLLGHVTYSQTTFEFIRLGDT